MWQLNPKSGAKIYVSSDPTYTFGFSGWPERKPIYDEFELYVWEPRKAAGIDEPMPEPIGYDEPILNWATTSRYAPGQNLAGQILFSGSFTVKSPKYHKQLYGITGHEQDSEEK